MAKLPAYQFYPGDWMKDPALRSVSPAARGIWIDMLCLMFESPRRGYLQQANGKPLSQTQIARMTGCVPDEAAHLLQELDDAGVYSRTGDGIIYSRRMVRDEVQRESWRERQNKHRGRDVTRVVTRDVTQESHVSSSSPSSSKQDPPRAGPTPQVIACAHPLAATRGMTELQVPQAVCTAVIDVLAAGENATGLLAKVAAIRDVVLSEWPADQMKFLKSMDTFFREYEFNKPLEEWRHAKPRSDRQNKQPAAVERQRVTHDAIRAAGNRRYGNVAAHDDGPGTGVLPEPGATGRDS